MTIPSNLFATAFREHRLGLMFAVLVATLVYLATLAVAAQGALATASHGWGRNTQGRLTVEVSFPSDDSTKTQQERVKKITEALRSIPEVEQASPLPETEVARLLKPWFNDTALLSSLPLPALVDVEMKAGSVLSAKDLQQKLLPAVQDVRVQSRAEGLDKLLRLISSLRLLSWVMIGLTFVTLNIAITLICRAAMAVQHDTIELLHFMGATDSDIARQFLHHTRRLSLPASLVGFLAAVTTSGLFFYLAHNFWDQSLTLDAQWFLPGLLMAFVPFAAVVIAMIGAKLAVLALLKRMV